MIDARNKGESSYTSENLKINISQFFDSYKFSFWHGKISPSYNAWKKKIGVSTPCFMQVSSWYMNMNK